MNMQAQLQAALDAATYAPIIDDTSPVAVPLTDPPNTDDAASSWKHVAEVIPQPVAPTVQIKSLAENGRRLQGTFVLLGQVIHA